MLVVADTNSVEIRADGSLGRSPTSVARERAEHDGQQWVSATHDGYRERFGLIYARQLFLSAMARICAVRTGSQVCPGRPAVHLHPSASPLARYEPRCCGPSGSCGVAPPAPDELGESIFSGGARKTSSWC